MKYNKVLPVLILCVSLGLTACSSTANSAQGSEMAKTLTAVEVTKISPESITKEMAYAGQITALESVSVISKITGKVQEYYFDVGDTVKEGDVLFKLDEKDVRDQITQLNAQINQSNQSVRTAQNALNSVTGGQYQSSILQQERTIENYDKELENADIAIKNAETAVKNAEKALENTRTSFENTKALYEIEAVAKADFDKAELGLAAAEADYERAKNAYETALNGKNSIISAKNTAMDSLELTKGQITDDNKRNAQLALDSARAGYQSLDVQLQLAMETLEDTAVTAPISGMVSVRNAKTDEYVSSQMAAYTIINIDKVNVDVKVSELLINSIYVGQEVDVIVNSISGEALKGTIKTISPAADQTGTFPVKIELDNKDHVLKPGMFAEVRFVREKSENTIVLPRNTVLADESNSYVFVNENGIAKKYIVQLGIDNGELIEIAEGLNPGDMVVTKGQSFITDNEEINVVTVWGE